MKKIVIVALLSAFVATPALADNTGKLYGAIDLGQGNAKDACTGLPSTISCSTTTTAFRFGLGYQANQVVSLEAAYIDGGKIDIGGNYLGVPVTGEMSMTGFQLSAIGSYPISNEAELLGKIGFASIKAKESASALGFSASSDNSNSNATFGIGGRYKINDKLAIRVMYEDFGTIKASSNGGGSNVTLLSAGLQVGF